MVCSVEEECGITITASNFLDDIGKGLVLLELHRYYSYYQALDIIGVGVL